MDNNLVIDVIKQIKTILGMNEDKKINKFYDEGGFWTKIDDELVVGTEAWEDEGMTIKKADGEYLVDTMIYIIKDGIIVEVKEKEEAPEEPEMPEEPETNLDEKDVLIEKLTKDLELLTVENEKLKKLCEDNQLDITELKSDIDKFKKNEFKLKKEIEKLGNEPQTKSLNEINLKSDIKKDSLDYFNQTNNFLKSIL